MQSSNTVRPALPIARQSHPIRQRFHDWLRGWEVSSRQDHALIGPAVESKAATKPARDVKSQVMPPWVGQVLCVSQAGEVMREEISQVVKLTQDRVVVVTYLAAESLTQST